MNAVQFEQLKSQKDSDCVKTVMSTEAGRRFVRLIFEESDPFNPAYVFSNPNDTAIRCGAQAIGLFIFRKIKENGCLCELNELYEELTAESRILATLNERNGENG